jgi:hypothetical protein
MGLTWGEAALPYHEHVERQLLVVAARVEIESKIEAKSKAVSHVSVSSA